MFLRDGRKVLALAAVVALLGVAACGDDNDDDGALVREDPESEGSGSASGSGSGPASGSASGSASAPAEAPCVYVGNVDEAPKAWVDLTLTEFSIAPQPSEVKAGPVEFIARNTGAEPHELVIVPFDGDPADLPTDADGGVDEAKLPEGTEIFEIEGFTSENICAATFELKAGKYALFCNIIEEEDNGEKEAHYAEGMYTSFTVT